MYRRLITAMELMQKNRPLFGASVTVTTDNLREVASRGFIDDLRGRGCKAIVYVEYVPVSDDTWKPY